jgi:hypothetical protein
MKLHAGTSGFAFKEWKGSFYPSELKDDAMLGFYASRFPTVGDQQHVLSPSEGRRSAIVGGPGSRAVHLRDQGEPAYHAFRATEAGMRERRRVPAEEHVDARRSARTDSLSAPAESEEGRRPSARVPRHAAARSTLHDRVPRAELVRRRVYELLRQRDVAMCIIDQPEFSSPFVATSTWGYVRLHRFDYDASALTEWASRIQGQGWEEAYVYFKHDEGIGSGPPAVDAFLSQWGENR